MKPDWKDAPEWANWLAMDENGAWCWYELEPRYDGEMWLCSGKWKYACSCQIAGESKEARP